LARLYFSRHHFLHIQEAGVRHTSKIVRILMVPFSAVFSPNLTMEATSASEPCTQPPSRSAPQPRSAPDVAVLTRPRLCTESSPEPDQDHFLYVFEVISSLQIFILKLFVHPTFFLLLLSVRMFVLRSLYFYLLYITTCFDVIGHQQVYKLLCCYVGLSFMCANSSSAHRLSQHEQVMKDLFAYYMWL
jgi:hypothetical protein